MMNKTKANSFICSNQNYLKIHVIIHFLANEKSSTTKKLEKRQIYRYWIKQEVTPSKF